MTGALGLIQQRFAEALDDPRGEELLLPHVSPKRGTAHLPEAMKRAGSNAIRERLGLYRGNVRAHWRAALANAYPVLEALVGDPYFDGLSLAYARAHPSQSGDLNGFGSELPAFLKGYERNGRFRYFVDVARLEWALHIAYFAADAESSANEAWLDIGEERLLNARVLVHPACTAITSHYAIADIWFAHQPGGCFPQSIDSPTWALTVRSAWQPTVLVHSAAAHAAFMALKLGKSLNEALDAAFAVDTAFNFTSQWQAWIAARAITGAVI